MMLGSPRSRRSSLKVLPLKRPADSVMTGQIAATTGNICGLTSLSKWNRCRRMFTRSIGLLIDD